MAKVKYATRSFGNKVREWREKTGLTQGQCAQEAGVSQGYLSQLEHGDVKNPSFSILNRIADTLVRYGMPKNEVPRLYESAGLDLEWMARNYAINKFLGMDSASTPVTSYSNVGTAIRSIRNSRGMSQASVANGICQGYLSQLETEVHNPSPHILNNIAKALNATPAEFLSLLRSFVPEFDASVLMDYLQDMVREFEEQSKRVHENILAGMHGFEHLLAYKRILDVETWQSPSPDIDSHYEVFRKTARDFRRSTLEMFMEVC